MSVVLRCPSCGTTKATSGECEACQGAQVRYFCDSHVPGVWLASGTCPQCGARFGEATSPMPAPYLEPLLIRSRRAAARDRREPPRETLPEEVIEPASFPAPMWQQLLRALVRARFVPPTPTRERGSPSLLPSAGGCLKRAVLMIVVLTAVLCVAAFLFGRVLLGF